MGKGSSGAGNRTGGGGGKAVTSVTTQGGVTLDLSATPLVYGENDTALSDRQRHRLEVQERQRLKAKTEYGMMVDADGVSMGERHGGSGSVRTPHDWWTHTDAVFTHNHPRGKNEEGLLGGTFSEADANSWAKNRVKTIRASAAEGTYSMSKGANFNAYGFMAYYRQVQVNAQSRMNAARRELDRQFATSTKLSYSEYAKKHADCFNTFLIECHNGLLAGQKQYGYSYTLEARNNG